MTLHEYTSLVGRQVTFKDPRTNVRYRATIAEVKPRAWKFECFVKLSESGPQVWIGLTRKDVEAVLGN